MERLYKAQCNRIDVEQQQDIEMMLGVDILCNMARIYQSAVHIEIESVVARRIWRNIVED